ncbi:MAG: CHAP domain-containing protein [Oscillospiraceae bacterium]|nr:CHAP domain-containing protein [Oscillospiraceae bacterium]
MKEQELRQRVADIINGWIGATKGSPVHLAILKEYNGYKPLAAGYVVKPTDAYCAATVSAAWIKAGIAAYTGTESGVERFVRLAQDKGIWTENDAYVPKVGDAIVYDWQDTGAGDNRGYSDHIGIVTKVDSAKGMFVVTEGNMSGGKVATRSMLVNGRYIRGYITPNYAAIAKALSGASIHTENDPDQTSKSIEEIAREVIAGMWGSGAERRPLLQAAGYAYSTVQAKVNELFAEKAQEQLATTAAPTQPAAPAKAPVSAEKFDRSIAGTYIVTPWAGVNIRRGPGTDYDIIKSVGTGTRVNNYGYYSIRGGKPWYFVRVGAATGFVHADYLKKA